MKNNYIVIHGSFGTPFVNWFKWLNDELVKLNKEVIVPQFPIGVKYQNYNNWSNLLKYYYDLGFINENTVIIGHSIAPIFITKFLIENNIKVKRLIYVSGFNNYFLGDNDYDTVNKTFFSNDIKELNEHCKDIICIYSNNDPYLPFQELEKFCDEINGNKAIIKEAGHINSESGYNSLEEILKYL